MDESLGATVTATIITLLIGTVNINAAAGPCMSHLRGLCHLCIGASHQPIFPFFVFPALFLVLLLPAFFVLHLLLIGTIESRPSASF